MIPAGTKRGLDAARAADVARVTAVLESPASTDGERAQFENIRVALEGDTRRRLTNDQRDMAMRILARDGSSTVAIARRAPSKGSAAMLCKREEADHTKSELVYGRDNGIGIMCGPLPLVAVGQGAQRWKVVQP